MITKTSLTAIKAFTILAKLPKGKFEGTAKIATEIGAAQNYLGKVLQSFCAKGFLSSQKGLGGGLRLNRDSKKITLFDIVDSIENISDTSECFFGSKKCDGNAPCVVHEKWKETRGAYMDFLRKTTIFDLTLK